MLDCLYTYSAAPRPQLAGYTVFLENLLLFIRHPVRRCFFLSSLFVSMTKRLRNLFCKQLKHNYMFARIKRFTLLQCNVHDDRLAADVT